jgi:hypothetical protein
MFESNSDNETLDSNEEIDLDLMIGISDSELSSDSDTNNNQESAFLLPLLIIFKRRLQSITAKEEFKKYFSYIYYGGILIIILLLNCILTIESLDLDHILLCSAILAKLKGKMRLLENISGPSESRSTAPLSKINEEIDSTSDKEYKRSDGTDTNEKELPDLPFRDSVVTTINYPGIIIETAPIEEVRISNQTVNGSTLTTTGSGKQRTNKN